jgi:hypothetical protein
MGTNRMDAFIAKIPSRLLMESTVPVPPTVPPTLLLMALAGGALLLGSMIVVLANARRADPDPGQAAHSGRRAASTGGG